MGVEESRGTVRSTSDTRGIQVLHVDDESDFAEVTATYLEREDDRLRVSTAAGAREALGVLETRSFDCVVSDYQMPEVDGLEFLDAVRERYPDLPFILFTGKGSEEIASEAISQGVTDYLQKGGPDKYPILANRIENAVDQYRMERRLRRQNDLFERAQDIADVGAWEYDVAAGTFQWTAEIERILGVSPDGEPTLSDALRVVHPGDRPDVEAAFDAVVRSGEVFDIEVRLGDGTDADDYQWVRIRGEPHVRTDDPDRIRGTLQDITRHKHRERELQSKTERLERMHEQLELALESTDTYTWDWDPVNREVVRHPTVEQLFGIDPDSLEPVFDSFIQQIHPDHRDRIAQLYRDALAEGSSFEARFPLEKDSGSESWVWVEERGQVITDEDGNAYRVVGTTTDISDQLERERQLEHERGRVADVTEIVSRKLQSRLTVAAGHLEMTREQRDDEHLQQVATEMERIDRLISDLLVLERQGEPIEDTSRVDVAETARCVWDDVETGDATLEIVDEVSVQSDRNRLELLFVNLFENAITHVGEDVTVEVGGLEDGFYVADDGPGIPEAEREDAFDLEYTTAEGGTGFGLRIVETIAHAHGWTLTLVESDAGGLRVECSAADVEY